ncbi:ABC transporter permease family protein [Phaeodactylibacter luteus]|uniref:FtsX-like permease family protein n=1 Tax=Phaeodactylibacter luteus TaxID=1564516 RepID=A0A5C6S247_9BACT|nr:FtsX-like permease family protein [Phaeodactylibacter luteus]TXB68305.1 FtsX-like permease family protein [Phaeodactylibacter luteus]
MDWKKWLLRPVDEFEKLFAYREYIALAHKGRPGSLFWLWLILWLTLMALGFAFSSLEDLQQRMDNPYSTWVNLPIDTYIDPVLTDVLDSVSAPDRRTALGLDTVVEWNRFSFTFLPARASVFSKGENGAYYWGRTIDFGSELFDRIISDGNLRHSSWPEGTRSTWNEALKGGIVVSQSLLYELGYEWGAEPLYIPVYDSTYDGVFFVPVWGVVEKLPSKVVFLGSYSLYQTFKSRTYARNAIRTNEAGSNRYSFLVALGVETEAKKAFKKRFGEAIEELEYRQFGESSSGKLVQINLFLNLQATEVQSGQFPSLADSLLAAASWEGMPLFQYECKLGRGTANKAHYLAFSFAELEKVRLFSSYLERTFEIKVPLETVEAKENFALVSLLGYAISLMLLGFAVLAVVLFINNLLSAHIREITPVMGTLKAFGLSAGKISRIYSKIVLAVLIVAGAFAWLCAFVAGQVLGILLPRVQIEVVDWRIAMALLMVVLLSLLFARRLIHRVLSRTPGDLVYQRGGQ